MVKLGKKVLGKRNGVRGESPRRVICSSCGALIRASMDGDTEQVCLICHARMLNEKFHSLRKRSDEDRDHLAASE